jgi:hypothetical protein
VGGRARCHRWRRGGRECRGATWARGCGAWRPCRGRNTRVLLRKMIGRGTWVVIASLEQVREDHACKHVQARRYSDDFGESNASGNPMLSKRGGTASK